MIFFSFLCGVEDNKKHGTDTDTVFDGAREKIRTSTEVNPHGPEPCASASSATRAHLSLSASAD